MSESADFLGEIRPGRCCWRECLRPLQPLQKRILGFFFKKFFGCLSIGEIQFFSLQIFEDGLEEMLYQEWARLNKISLDAWSDLQSRDRLATLRKVFLQALNL